MVLSQPHDPILQKKIYLGAQLPISITENITCLKFVPLQGYLKTSETKPHTAALLPNQTQNLNNEHPNVLITSNKTIVLYYSWPYMTRYCTTTVILLARGTASRPFLKSEPQAHLKLFTISVNVAMDEFVLKTFFIQLNT